jgi:hypothetical protein
VTRTFNECGIPAAQALRPIIDDHLPASTERTVARDAVVALIDGGDFSRFHDDLVRFRERHDMMGEVLGTWIRAYSHAVQVTRDAARQTGQVEVILTLEVFRVWQRCNADLEEEVFSALRDYPVALDFLRRAIANAARPSEVGW